MKVISALYYLYIKHTYSLAFKPQWYPESLITTQKGIVMTLDNLDTV